MAFPPGVTGSEYAITKWTYEVESSLECPRCGATGGWERGYRNEHWLDCPNGHTTCTSADKGD